MLRLRFFWVARVMDPISVMNCGVPEERLKSQPLLPKQRFYRLCLSKHFLDKFFHTKGLKLSFKRHLKVCKC